MEFKHACFSLLILLILSLLSIIAVADKPATAVKFVILKPSDSTVGAPITVTIEAQKSNNKVDESYQNDVTLIVSGSATGAGLVDVVNGVGTIEINDGVAETVILSLSDTEGTGLDVSSTQEVNFEVADSAVWSQTDFLFRDDDGTEVSATGYGSPDAGENTNITGVVSGAVFRLRFGIRVIGEDGIIVPRLEFKQGTDCAVGGWTAVTPTSDAFSLRLSDNFSDGDATTKQITGGSFAPGQILESTNPASSLSVSKNKNTEYEWSVRIADNISSGATYSFRISNNGTALDDYDVCSSLTIQAGSGPEPVSSGGGGKVRPTTVTFSGKAFPDAKVMVIDKDIRFGFEKALNQNIVADENGFFQISFVGILQSFHTFGLLIKDKENRTVQTEFFNVNTLTDDLVVKDIFVPPTVGLVERLVTRGRNIAITGYATPGSSVVVEIDDTIREETRAREDGSYRIAVNTGVLEFGTHRVKARQIDAGQERESAYSPTNAFVVSRLTSPKTDLSGDGVVDIKDWSMFLSRWGSKDESQKKMIDFNDDGEVNISDFSMFIRTIKK